MLGMSQFINIHTHNSEKTSNVISLQSFSLSEDFSKASLPISVGIHPWNLENQTLEKARESLVLLLKSNSIAAIGECGLDKVCKTPFEKQLLFFEMQLALAEEFDIPVIIHSVKSHSELLHLRKIFPKAKWIVHGFCGNIKIATQLIEKNIFLSFGVQLLKENNNLCTLFLQIDEKHLFLETDISNRSIFEIYEFAASLRNLRVTELAEIIFKNYIFCFGDRK